MAATLPGSEAVGELIAALPVPYLADGVTPTPGATVLNAVWTVSDPTIVKLFRDNPTDPADTDIICQGLIAGVVTLSVTAQVTDSDGLVQTLSGTNTLTVTGGLLTTGLQIAFSTPTP